VGLMPIATPPAKLAYLQPQDLVNAPMAGPLSDLLDATNHLYWKHIPAWISHAVSADKSAATVEYVIPVPPASADALRYAWRICLEAGAVGTCTVTIYETNTFVPAAAAWSAISTNAGTALINGLTVLSVNASVSADTTMIKVKTSAATTAVRPTHIYASPGPDSAGAPFLAGGVTASGFRVHDGTMLGTSGRPVTQELVDRCHRNTASVIRDRRQVLASLLCPLDRSGVTLKAPQTWTGTGAWCIVGRATAQIPESNVSHSVNIRVHASRTGGGATADLVEVAAVNGSQAGQKSVTFAADDEVHSASLTVYPDAAGFVDFRVRVRAGAGQTTYIHAVTIDWQAGQYLNPSARLTGTGLHTPASGALLSSAWDAIRVQALRAYCAVGHMVDSVTANRRNIWAHISVPRCVTDHRVLVWRCTDSTTGAPTATYLYGTTDGSIAAPTDAVEVQSGLWGADVYWDCQASTGAPQTALLIGGTTHDASPAGDGFQNRALNVTEALVPSIELIEIKKTCGFTLYPGEQSATPWTL